MKKIIIFILLLLVVFSIGCDRFGIRTEKEGDIAGFAKEYRVGFGGLELGFFPGMPPDEIYESNEFKVGIELKNRGAHKIDHLDLNFSISGYDEKYIKLSDKYIEYTEDTASQPILDGRSNQNPEGGYDLKTFTGRNVKMPTDLDEYNAVFVVSACYKYETRASADVCIDPFMYDPLKGGRGVCTVQKLSLTGGQGGPVAVTEIDEQIATKEGKLYVVFTVKVENKGEGKIRDFESRCVKEGEIKFVAFLPNLQLKCEFDKNINVGSCWGEIDETYGAYTAPLLVIVNYDYTTSATKKMKVKRIPGFAKVGGCPSGRCHTKSECWNGYGGYDTSLRCVGEPDKVCCKEIVPNCCEIKGCESLEKINSAEYACRLESECDADTIERYYCTDPKKTCCKAKS